ncbi:hypothetical protein SCHPADRAFT_874700 [Schizopora paradoxa]|uniref:Acyl-CoA dehydrogenase NM domain-like protein n=1 Tax=Schizopora paradoxa TaxID=27342 RepID=A0A0H2S821_9AGAM|nr:hypothetical protein SCHPADRAFT_874700 [Schizopora paradoxa]
MRVEEGFQQCPYDEQHPYISDPLLSTLLQRVLPEQTFALVNEDLIRFGERVTTEIRHIADRATPPVLIQYDQLGRRIDDLQTCESWRLLKAIAQEEGIVAIQYERKSGAYSRVHSFAKQLLMVGDCQTVFCPLSMTDGAARVLELEGTQGMKQEILSKLVSRDAKSAFTAGQWMTERPGGSDVSQTETTATLPPDCKQGDVPGARYILNGFKWFSSATDSHVALALARTGPVSSGSRSLSLFLVPLRLPLSVSNRDNTSNGVFVHRLKNKFGTQIVPTAELSLEGTEAYLVGPLNRGVKTISSVLNITRLYCACDSLGSLRRGFAIARAYAYVRTIDGGKQLLRDNPVHTAELAKVSLIYGALMQLFFGAVLLLGRVECNVASEDEKRRLRLLTPVVKAFCAEKAVAALEECMAALGGLGYMEETGIGRLIRDSLVEKIWEGTITVLSLDLMRAASDPEALPAYTRWTDGILTSVPSGLQESLHAPLEFLKSARSMITNLFTKSDSSVPSLVPRPALMLFAYITTAFDLLEHAIWSDENRPRRIDVEVSAEAFRRWVEEAGLREAMESVKVALAADGHRIRMDEMLVYGEKTRIEKARL